MIDLWDVSAIVAIVVLVGALAIRRFHKGGCGTGCGGCDKTPGPRGCG